MTLIKAKPMTVGKYYKGACRVPGCLNDSYARGVCKNCYNEIMTADAYGRSWIRDELQRVGIVMPKSMTGKQILDYGVSLELRHYPADKWLPEKACTALGRRYFLPDGKGNKPNGFGCRVETKKSSNEQEWDAVMEFAKAVDWKQFPDEIFQTFGKLTEAQLCDMAWKGTRWSPATTEKLFIFQIRVNFGCNFSKLGGSGIHHRGDNKEPGTGTPLERHTNWESLPVAVEDEEFFDE